MKRAIPALAALLLSLTAVQAQAEDASKGPKGPKEPAATTDDKPDEVKPTAKPDPYTDDKDPAPADTPKKKKTPGLRDDEDPLAIPEGLKAEIGSSYLIEDKVGEKRKRTGLFPFAYRERFGNQLTTTVFPFYYDRKTFSAAEPTLLEDHQSLYGLYYRRRSVKVDLDIVFPLFFRAREENTTTYVVPPVMFRDAPGEWHRWIAPLLFAGSGKDGGYFYSPAILTFSQHSKKRAFTSILGVGFYDRTDRNVDWGVAPLVFGGSDGDKLTSYLVIPPILTYHSSNRDTDVHTTLVGPVYHRTSPTTTTTAVVPLFYHSHGTENGEDYSTTYAGLVYRRKSKDKSALVVAPFFGSFKDAEGTTLITPFYSSYRGRTQLDLAGPIVPLFAHYKDPDIGSESWMIGPTYYGSDPHGHTLVTPLFGQWAEYGVSRTTWIFPTFVHTADTEGWSFQAHPLLYLKKTKTSRYAVQFPLYWDYENEKDRTTFAPLFYRYRSETSSATYVINTLYTENRTRAGTSWDFWFLPVFHIESQPTGGGWDLLFGLVGYKRRDSYKQLRLLWIPIDLTKNPDDVLVKPAIKKKAVVRE